MFGMAASFASVGLPDLAKAQTSTAAKDKSVPTLFVNARMFDGKSAKLLEGVSVLVLDDRIASIDTGKIMPPDGATVIDCGGRTLMPGLIDAHWHAMMASLPLPTLLTADVGYIHLAASAEAERTLMRGFTTIRDLGGPAFALKKAIDAGIIVGPRIYPSGAVISQTAGHTDFRNVFETPRVAGTLSRPEVLGASYIADSPDEVRRATREQLMAGATQIKIAAGGGVASLYDPLDVLQFRPEEIRAAVEAAADWGTYVCAHAYMPESIKRCVEAGVKCIEHGQLADEESVKIMVGEGTKWCLQPFTEETDVNRYPDADRQGKQKKLWDGTDNAYNLAIKNNMTVSWGTDVLFDAKGAETQGGYLAAMKRWFSPAQVLKMATSDNADYCAMSGPRNPYAGKIGVIEKDAFADMLLVDGNPLENIDLVADAQKNFKIIMKGGQIYKNTL
jgi:imidazolonepropionase-like amidohydrolase